MVCLPATRPMLVGRTGPGHTVFTIGSLCVPFTRPRKCSPDLIGVAESASETKGTVTPTTKSRDTTATSIPRLITAPVVSLGRLTVSTCSGERKSLRCGDFTRSLGATARPTHLDRIHQQGV